MSRCKKTLNINDKKKCFVYEWTDAEKSFAQKRREEEKKSKKSILDAENRPSSSVNQNCSSSSEDDDDEPVSKRRKRKEEEKKKSEMTIMIAEVEPFGSGYLIKKKLIIRNKREFLSIFTSLSRYIRLEVPEDIIQLSYGEHPQV